MPDFRFTPKLGGDNPPPTVCTFCNTHACDEGFVDLLVNHVPEGRIYACARCIWTAARLVGCLDPQQVEALIAERDDSLLELSTVNEQLVVEKETKVVPLAEVLSMLGQGDAPANVKVKVK